MVQENECSLHTGTFNVQWTSRLLLLSMPVTPTTNFIIFLRDVSRAYKQAKWKAGCIWSSVSPLPLILKVPLHRLFQILRLLEGLAEFGMYRFTNYHGHHREKLLLIAALHDLTCLVNAKSFQNSSSFFQWSRHYLPPDWWNRKPRQWVDHRSRGIVFKRFWVQTIDGTPQ